jgi:hypothetical protein
LQFEIVPPSGFLATIKNISNNNNNNNNPSTMTLISDMPFEILANILTSTVTRALTRDENPLYLTRITSTLRTVALATPELWQYLFTKCRIHSDTLMVPASYIHFLGWWSDRIGNRNQLALRFDIDFVAHKEERRWVTLDRPILCSIVDFITRARYLEVESRGVKFLSESLQGSGMSPVSRAQSMGMNGIADDNAEMGEFLGLFRIPALRKLTLCDPTLRDVAHQGIWSQLTHIRVSLVITLEQWRTFIRDCASLESAWVTLNLSRKSTSVKHPMHPISNLHELAIKVDSDVGDIFNGIRLPALKTLLLAAPSLTLDGLHALLEATPLLERIRLSTIFPISDHEPWMEFPKESTSLAHHAPHLHHLMLDIPDIPISLRHYVDGIGRSGWLKGPWVNGPLRFDFYWLYGAAETMRDLEQYLHSSGIEQVNTTVRERVETIAETNSSDIPFWDLWYDLGAEF